MEFHSKLLHTQALSFLKDSFFTFIIFAKSYYLFVHKVVRSDSSPEPLEKLKHEWYHDVKNCLGHIFSHHCLPKVAKNCQKKAKSQFSGSDGVLNISNIYRIFYFN